MNSVNILFDKCQGCGRCLSACFNKAIYLVGNKAKINESCTMCRVCIEVCKYGAIYGPDSKENSYTIESSNKGLWVFVEHKNGTLAKVSLELLGKGREMAHCMKVPLYAIIFGNNIKEAAQKLIHYGADKVYCIENEILESFNDELYFHALVQLINKFKPEIVLFGATTYGRSLAPRVASRLNTGLTADCTDLQLDADKKNIVQIRPAFGGNLMAEIICPNHRPQMATVRPGVMKALKPDMNRIGEVLFPEVELPEDIKVKVMKTASFLSSLVDISEAEVVVAVGRGIESPENIKIIEELANVLGGAVGASRAVVDAGWMDYHHQIGQTGRVVSPKIYIACGISGAVQHLAGMASSDIIIAINNNPNAPIFKVAHYGIVGDIFEVIPALIQEFKAGYNMA